MSRIQCWGQQTKIIFNSWFRRKIYWTFLRVKEKRFDNMFIMGKISGKTNGSARGQPVVEIDRNTLFIKKRYFALFCGKWFTSMI